MKRVKTNEQVYVPKGLWKYEDEQINSNGEYKEFNSIAGIPIILEKL